jgi:hypothetical protein
MDVFARRIDPKLAASPNSWPEVTRRLKSHHPTAAWSGHWSARRGCSSTSACIPAG